MTVGSKRRIRIVALGSPHGDDRVGWAIARRLAQDEEIAPLVHVLRSPWDFVNLLVANCSVIVVDACLASGSAGTVSRIGAKELAASGVRRKSTHSGSLMESLELAKSLQKEIRELVVFAVAVESCEPGAELSESARGAVDDVVRQVQALLSEWLPKR